MKTNEIKISEEQAVKALQITLSHFATRHELDNNNVQINIKGSDLALLVQSLVLCNWDCVNADDYARILKSISY